MSLGRVKIGRLKYDSVTRKVTPIPAKGELNIRWIDDEKHLHWSSEDKNADELDIIVFAGDARFDIYRNNIFILWFQTYEDKYFFWLQVMGRICRKRFLLKRLRKRSRMH